MSQRRPNVLMMVADDHWAQAMAAHGDCVVRTPCMDRLCAEGIDFRQNRHQGSLSGAVCGPARAALLTGISPLRASVGQDTEDFWSVGTIRSEHVTLPQAFRDAGYRTVGIGKWHNDKPAFARSFSDAGRVFFGGMTEPFDVHVQEFDPSGVYADSRNRPVPGFSTEIFADEAIGRIRDHDGRQPLFMYVAFTSPHDPRKAPPEWHAMYPVEQVPLPPNFVPEHPFDTGTLSGRDEDLAGHPRTEAEVRQHLSDYYAMISSQDHQMSRILEALEAAGMLEDTIVVYTGDHGIAIGQHGLMGKQSVYEHSIRTPLIMRGPGVPRGVACDALTYTSDLYPTLCEVAGVAVPEAVEATSLTPLFDEPNHSHRSHVTCFFKRFQRMITDGRHKLIRTFHDPLTGRGENYLQFFDLEADPWENRNLAEDPKLQTLITSFEATLFEAMAAERDPLLEVLA